VTLTGLVASYSAASEWCARKIGLPITKVNPTVSINKRPRIIGYLTMH
jgi:hypothetical protein